MLFDSGGKAFWLTAALSVLGLEPRLHRDVILDVLTPLCWNPDPSFQLWVLACWLGVLYCWHSGAEMGLLAFKVPETTLKTEKSETTVENGNEDSAMSPEDRDFLPQALDAFLGIEVSLSDFLCRRKKGTTQICKRIFQIMDNLWLGVYESITEGMKTVACVYIYFKHLTSLRAAWDLCQLTKRVRLSELLDCVLLDVKGFWSFWAKILSSHSSCSLLTERRTASFCLNPQVAYWWSDWARFKV